MSAPTVCINSIKVPETRFEDVFVATYSVPLKFGVPEALLIDTVIPVSFNILLSIIRTLVNPAVPETKVTLNGMVKLFDGYIVALACASISFETPVALWGIDLGQAELQQHHKDCGE